MKVIIVGGVASPAWAAEAAATLATGDGGWLARLISRRVPPDRIADARQRGPDDIEVVVDVTAD